jgi:hypothetical protein
MGVDSITDFGARNMDCEDPLEADKISLISYCFLTKGFSTISFLTFIVDYYHKKIINPNYLRTT